MSGERQGDREAMRVVIKDLIASGMEPREAERQARESMRRVDRRQRELGKR